MVSSSWRGSGNGGPASLLSRLHSSAHIPPKPERKHESQLCVGSLQSRAGHGFMGTGMEHTEYGTLVTESRGGETLEPLSQVVGLLLGCLPLVLVRVGRIDVRLEQRMERLDGLA